MVFGCLFWTEQLRAVAGCLPADGDSSQPLQAGRDGWKWKEIFQVPTHFLTTSTEAPGRQREAPGVLGEAASEQTQPWPTSRSSGSSGSSKKFSKVKRCGNVAASFATPILKPEMCSCCLLLKMSDLHRQYVRAPPKITSANVRARSRRVVVGQALNRLTTLALAWYQCWVEPLLAVPGGRVQETPGT